MSFVICKQCKRTCNNSTGAFIAGWLKIDIFGRGLEKSFWVCDKCSSETVNIQFNIKENKCKQKKKSLTKSKSG